MRISSQVRNYFFCSSKSARDLNKDLQKIKNRVYQWKIILKPDYFKEAQEVISNEKSTGHLALLFFSIRPQLIGSCCHKKT